MRESLGKVQSSEQPDLTGTSTRDLLDTDQNAENIAIPDSRAVNQITSACNKTSRLAEHIQQNRSLEHPNLQTKGYKHPRPSRNSLQRRQQDHTMMYGLQELRNRLYTEIYNTKSILEGIETPIVNTSQEYKNEERIRALNEAILSATTDLLDIEADHKNSIGSTELENLKISLYNIESKTSAAYNDLCTWKARTRPKVTTEAHKPTQQAKTSTLRNK